MKPEKENWINDVLGSLDGLNQTEPSPFLFAKIRNHLTVTPSALVVPGRVVWLAAASFAVLALLNWQLLATTREKAPATSNDLTTVITDMNLSPTNNQLYDLWSGPNY